MNKKVFLTSSAILISFLSVFIYIESKNKNVDSTCYNVKNEYSDILKLNMAMNSKDFNFIKTIPSENILTNLVSEKYYNFVLTSLILNDMDKVAFLYANKVLESGNSNNLAISFMAYYAVQNNDLSILNDALATYKDKGDLYYSLKSLQFFNKKDDESKFDSAINSINVQKTFMKNKYFAFKEQAFGNNDKAIDLFNKSIKEKYLMGSLYWLSNVYLVVGEKDKAVEILEKYQEDKNNSIMFSELINKVKSGDIKGEKIGVKNILAEMLFDNTFAEDYTRITLPYLSYKLDKTYSLPLILETTTLSTIGIYDKSNDIILNSENDSYLKDILQNQIADNYVSLKNNRDAEGIYKDLITKYPLNISLYVNLAGIYEDDGGIKKSIGIYSDMIIKTKESDRNAWILYFNRGVLFDKSGDWNSAEKDFEKTLTLNNANPFVLNYIGYSWIIRDKNKDEALGMIQYALKTNPFNENFIDSLAWGYYTIGDYNSAKNFLEPAKMVNSTNSIVNYHLGIVYDKLGRKREAIYQLQKALRFNETDKFLKSDEVDNCNKLLKEWKN